MFLFPILWSGECTKLGTSILLTVPFDLAISSLLFLQLPLLFSLVSLTPLSCFSAVCLLFSRCWEPRIFFFSFPERESFSSSSIAPMTSFLLSCLQDRRSNLDLLVYFLRCCVPPLLSRYQLVLSQFQIWLLQSKELLLFFQRLALFFCLFSFWHVFSCPFPAEMIFR